MFLIAPHRYWMLRGQQQRGVRMRRNAGMLSCRWAETAATAPGPGSRALVLTRGSHGGFRGKGEGRCLEVACTWSLERLLLNQSGPGQLWNDREGLGWVVSSNGHLVTLRTRFTPSSCIPCPSLACSPVPQRLLKVPALPQRGPYCPEGALPLVPQHPLFPSCPLTVEPQVHLRTF